MSSPLNLSDLLGWEATYSIVGGLSGVARFTNQNNQYGVDLLWTPINIATSVIVSSDLVDDSVFEGTVSWLRGIIHSVDTGREIANRYITLNVASFFSTLTNKSINTHLYNTTAGTVLLDVLQVYCGVPVTIFSITAAAAPIVYAIVQGSNVWEECVKLAQCCHSDMFVQVGGNLIIEPWKNHDSTVDYVLPREAVSKVTRIRNVEKGPSRVRVRGRAVSRYDCGPRLLSNDPTKAPEALNKSKCYRNGLGEPSSDLVLKNLGGSKTDLTNSGFILGGDLQFDKMQSADIKDGTATVHTRPADGTFLEPGTDSETTYKVFGRNKSTGDLEDNTSKLKNQKGNLKAHDKALAKLAGTPPGVFSISGKDPHLGGEAGDKTRLEVMVNDLGLQAEFGIVIDELDNPYISVPYSAFILGIRKIQEFLMGRNKYKVNCAFLPVLTLNDVITITVPDSDSTLTGRITHIHTVGDVESSAISMDLEIECFTELDGRVYQSGNLLIYPELCGINQVNWISNDKVYALSGYFGFEPGGIVYQPVFLELGLVYTFTAELLLISPTGSFTVEDVSSGTSTTITASGSITLSYTPLTTISNLRFTANSGEWFLSLPFLSTILTT